MLPRFTFLALLFAVLGPLVGQGFAQKKPKENAQVLVGIKYAAVDATSVITHHMYASGGSDVFNFGSNGPGSGTHYIDFVNVPLTPGVQYSMTLSCNNWSKEEVKFSAPPGYTIFLDDRPIPTRTTDLYFGGAGTYTINKIVLVPDDLSSRLPAGMALPPQVGDVVWSISAGTYGGGLSAGAIQWRANTLSPDLLNATALVYTPPATSEIRSRRYSDGGLLEVDTFQFILYVRRNSTVGTGYTIEIYDPTAVLNAAGDGYDIQPYRKFIISNPNASWLNEIKIEKLELSGGTDSQTWNISRPSGNWQIVETTGLRTTKLVSTVDGAGRVETVTVEDSAQKAATKVMRTYANFPAWGQEELMKEVADPDGLALTTSYDYYTARSASLGRLKSVTTPSGSVTSYEYDEGDFNWGDLTKVYRPWQTTANSQVTLLGYTGWRAVFSDNLLASSETQIDSTTVAKSTMSYATPADAANGEPLQVVTTQLYSAANATPPLTSTRTTYRDTASENYRFRIFAETHPDGTKVSMLRYKGNWVNYWQPNNLPEASYFKKTGNPATDTTWGEYQFSGFNSPVQGSVPVNSWDGQSFETVYMVPNRSTVELDLYNAEGRLWYRIQAIFTGAPGGTASFEFVSLHETGYVAGVAAIQKGSNGEQDELWLTRGQLSGHTNNDGTYVEFTRDALGRDYMDRRWSVDANAEYSAQGIVYTHKTFDIAGRTLVEKVSPSPDSAANPVEAVTTVRKFNPAGLLEWEKAESDGGSFTTSYAYANGGRTVTTTLPGNATKILDSYLDGSPQSVTGTAQIASYSTAVVNADGTITTQTNVGSPSSYRWSRVTTDWLGRTVETQSPAFGGGIVFTRTFYDATTGKPTKTTQTDGSGNQLRADTYVVYNAWQQPYRTGLRLSPGTPDLSNPLVPGSTDRITESDTFFEKDASGAWWTKSMTKTYSQDNNATPNTTGSVKTRLNKYDNNGAFFGSFVQSETVSTDVFGNETRKTIEVVASDKRVTETTYYSNSTVADVSVTRNGLLQKHQTKENLLYRYYYDSRGRLVKTTDPRKDTSAAPRIGYVDHSDRMAWADDFASKRTTYDYYPDTGRLYSVKDPFLKTAFTSYNDRGQVIHRWGAATYPVEYAYTADYGEQSQMKTFRDPSVDWTAGAWPGSASTGDTTKWDYDPATGLLLSKTDAQNQAVIYTYTPQRQLQTRTWARNAVTTYKYDSRTGEQTSIEYSDPTATPNISYTYDRRGLIQSVTDATGYRHFDHCDCGKVTAEYLSADFYQNRELHSALETAAGIKGRTIGMTVGTSDSPSSDHSINYGYDGYGRLNNIAGFGYVFRENSNLIASISDSGSGWAQRRFYESTRDLLFSVDTKFGTTLIARFQYAHDDLGRRISNKQTGALFASYLGAALQTNWGYNDRSEVINSTTTFLDGTPMNGRAYDFTYDSIGNRMTSSVDSVQTTYTPNSLNQYTRRAVPGQVLVTGLAPAGATVTDNDTPTNRQGEYFSSSRVVDNTSTSSWEVDTILSSLGGSFTRSSFLPMTPEAYTYDLDGNILTDGRWQYTWDAENRLVAIETLSVAYAVGAPQQRFEFQYDYMGRRVSKRALTWSGPGWSLVSERRFLYDGWNLVTEYNTASGFTLAAQHTWGIDLGGGLQNAGGVGGLLKTVNYEQGTVTLLPAYDGNGNVHAMIDRGTGAIRAAFEYSAFGETLRATGDMASNTPFRFSTKYTDQETQFVYYGFRYYNPNLGRFLGRDSIGEKGGLHLYGFVGNNGANKWDVLGRRTPEEEAKIKESIELTETRAREAWEDQQRQAFARGDQVPLARITVGINEGTPANARDVSWTPLGIGDITYDGQPIYGGESGIALPSFTVYEETYKPEKPEKPAVDTPTIPKVPISVGPIQVIAPNSGGQHAIGPRPEIVTLDMMDRYPGPEGSEIARDPWTLKIHITKMAPGLEDTTGSLFGNYAGGKVIGTVAGAILGRLAGLIGRAAETNTVTVGRWMSQAEADAITSSGRVQAPLNGTGQVYVTSPPNPGAFSPPASSTTFLQFDVPATSLRVTNPGEGWSVIDGPGSLMDRFGATKGLPPLKFPPATNPVPTASKWP